MRNTVLALLVLVPMLGCEGGEKPPSILDDFSKCMTEGNLKNTGIFPDGWVGESASCTLTQPSSKSPLVIRGMVPLLPNALTFTTEVQVSVDGTEVTRQLLGLGDFEVRCAPPPGADVRRVELHFSRTQRLPGGDTRSVGARLKVVGFEGAAK